jgi:glycosyltransferase involved in cell wall biosynthesis
MNNPTTYTLVIASYGYGHLAAHAIETALAQTKKFDKILFVDDGCGDCYHVLDLYSNSIDITIWSKNKGTVATYNEILNRVDTDYVMFMGADDWLRSDALELIDNEIGSYNTLVSRSPVVCVYDIMVTGEVYYDIYKNHSHQMTAKNGDYYWNIHGNHHGSMMYPTEVIKQLGGFRPSYESSRVGEDLYMWVKMMRNDIKAIHVREALLYYRRHKNNFNKY